MWHVFREDVKGGYLMKILVSFSDLAHEGQTTRVIPSGVAMVASYVLKNFKDKVEVNIFKYPEKFIEFLEQKTPKIACFSNYIWNINLSYEFARQIKKKSPDTIIIFGGPNYPTDKDEQLAFLLSHPDIDFYIEREGEQSCVELFSKLFENNFDFRKIKENKLRISNCHYINEEKLIQGELLPRMENLDNIPSPYLSGLCDQFLDGDLIPSIQGVRGCPFTCTYCQEGHIYFCKIRRFSLKRTMDEIEYIAQRTKAQSLLTTDSNFGMYEEDLEICRKIASVQKKYGWPEVVDGIRGKNCKERVLKALSIIPGTHLSVGIQSTDPIVLKNVKRVNIPINEMIEVSKEGEAFGSDRFSELILCLPGDTKEAHFKSIFELIDAGMDTIRSHQLIILPGSELATKMSRECYGIVARFRVTPCTANPYNLYGKIFSAPEIDEICVANNTMPFEDYLECRLFDLTVEIFYNNQVFGELLKFLNMRNIQISSFILGIHKRIGNFSFLSDLYNNFLTETKELFTSRGEVKAFLQQPGVIERYRLGELGNNEQLVYRTLAILDHMGDLHKIAFEVAKEMLIQKGFSDKRDSDYLRELAEFSLLRKNDILSLNTITKKFFHYNFVNLLASNFNEDPSSYYNPKKINILFNHTDDQKKVILNFLQIYGSSKEGIAFILSTGLTNTKNLYRNVKKLESELES